MVRENYQRYVFFALAVLLHVVVFFALCRFVVFTPEPIDTSSFQQVSLPKPPPPPEIPDTVTVKLPQIAPEAAAAPSAAPPALNIITTMKANFPTPSIDQHDLNGYANHLQGVMNGTANGNSTGDIGVLGNALAGDGRPGEIIGCFCPGVHPFSDAAPVDNVIRQDALDLIGWADGLEGPFHLVHGRNRTPLVEHPKWFYIANDNDGQQLDTAADSLAHIPDDMRIKTLVLVDDFVSARGHEGSQNAAAHGLVEHLYARRIRLCIITFKNAPYPPLMDYVRQSGGTVLYPNGIPAQQIAGQLKISATAP